MYLARILSHALIMIDFAIIIDIFKHKNIHHGVALNLQPEMSTRTLFHKTNLRFSSKNKENSSIIIPHFYQKIGIILNTSCKDWKNVFNSLDMANIFKSPFIWVVVTEDLGETTKVLSKYPIEIDSDITIIYKKDYNFIMYEIFNTGFALNGKVFVREIGFWNKTLHIERRSRLDLKGLVLKSTIVISKNNKIVHKTFSDFLEHHQPSLLTVDSMHKFKYFAVLKYYRDMFNISYTFQRSNSWGYPTNGSFDGMVGALQRFEADIGGSPLFVRTDRAEALDYAAETWQTRNCFIFRHPKNPGGFFTIYTRPLSTKLWYCIVAFLVMSSTILGLMLRLKRIKEPTDEEDESTSLAFLFILGAVCQQGMTIRRSSTSVKMVTFVTFFFTLTLYQYYNATVVSTLLQDPPKNIRNMEDLLKSNLVAGIEDELYIKDFFKRTTDPLALQMYKRISTGTDDKYFPPEVGMKSVKRGGYAFHVDSAVAYRIMKNTFSERELCEATEISMYVPQYLGAAVTKRSPYKEHIAYGIRLMRERGIMHRLQSIWDESRPECVRSPDSSLLAVTLQEFSTALMVLAVGFMAALVLLLFEVLLCKCRVQQNKVFAFTH